jgi:hypothetical protein
MVFIKLGVLILLILNISVFSFDICIELLTKMFRLSNINNGSDGSNEKMNCGRYGIDYEMYR